MKRHATDTVSLVFGLLFAAVVGWWGISEVTGGSAELPAAWIGVATLLVIGVVGLVSALRPRPAARQAVPAIVPTSEAPTSTPTSPAGSASDGPTLPDLTPAEPASDGPEQGTRGGA